MLRKERRPYNAAPLRARKDRRIWASQICLGETAPLKEAHGLKRPKTRGSGQSRGYRHCGLRTTTVRAFCDGMPSRDQSRLPFNAMRNVTYVRYVSPRRSERNLLVTGLFLEAAEKLGPFRTWGICLDGRGLCTCRCTRCRNPDGKCNVLWFSAPVRRCHGIGGG